MELIGAELGAASLEFGERTGSEDDDLASWVVSFESGDQIQPGGLGKLDIEEDDVGDMMVEEFQGLEGVAGMTGDGGVGDGVHPGDQAFTEKVGAFHDEHGAVEGGNGRGTRDGEAENGFVGCRVDPMH